MSAIQATDCNSKRQKLVAKRLSTVMPAKVVERHVTLNDISGEGAKRWSVALVRAYRAIA
jgi:hypothetical protein